MYMFCRPGLCRFAGMLNSCKKGYDTTKACRDDGPARFELPCNAVCYERMQNPHGPWSADAVDSSGKTGNLAGSGILMKNALLRSLIDYRSRIQKLLRSQLPVGSLDSSEHLLGRGLYRRLDRLVSLLSDLAGQNTLLRGLNVCQNAHLQQ